MPIAFFKLKAGYWIATVFAAGISVLGALNNEEVIAYCAAATAVTSVVLKSGVDAYKKVREAAREQMIADRQRKREQDIADRKDLLKDVQRIAGLLAELEVRAEQTAKLLEKSDTRAEQTMELLEKLDLRIKAAEERSVAITALIERVQCKIPKEDCPE